MTRLQADFLLLLTSLIWGTAFVAQIFANQVMPPISFVGVRFLISAIPLLPLAWFETLRRPERLNTKDWLLALGVGGCLLIGATLQQVGLKTTTATNAGFLTSLYIIIVPLMAWWLAGVRPRPIHHLSVLISIVGAWCLSGAVDGMRFSRGDWLILVSDVAWALAITLVPVFLASTKRPFLLSLVQYLVVGLVAMPLGLTLENFVLLDIWRALPFLLYTGLVSGSLAYTLQVVAQGYTPPTEAALIMSLESIIAALSGAWWLGERLTMVQTIGCVLIFSSVAIAEVVPALLGCSSRSNG